MASKTDAEQNGKISDFVGELRNDRGELVGQFWSDVQHKLFIFRYRPECADEKLQANFNRTYSMFRAFAQRFGWALVDYTELKRAIDRFAVAARQNRVNALPTITLVVRVVNHATSEKIRLVFHLYKIGQLT
jgi:hypothetical protein